ncbi:hypothetical protein D6853_08865 [Butyrivibrio sp. X503]|uniref:epoxyqueuosine reductase QueH n=1 Tax=Butyrivibrio sp. X503 TaxID=2364878 RepID=UPI000EA9AB02|nr:epoxyqueuosine reductase QueH [Butyrivibrio sp. X503]RKM55656.1 hypothetical protein D6853_08865 [Butyrivibrio sp. X503]
MNKRNYYKELENKIDEFQKNGVVPKLLLHVCCAPCSSHCLEFLRQYFDVTVFFYNPNITEDREYHKRVAEEKRLIEEYNRQVEEKNFEGMHSDEHARKIAIIEGEYDPKEYFEAVKGYEDIPEGGERCRKCFELRLRKTAETAAKEGFEYFTTTLTISPLKNADVLNEIGEKVAGKAVSFLPSDFKKKDGYKRSIELSQRFCLYRQDYCGCGFSKAERERQKAEDKEK